MKKESAKTQKKDVKPVVKAKRQPVIRSTSKQRKAVTAVEEVPEIIEQPAEQQPAPQVVDAAGTDSAEITEQSPEPQVVDTVTATIPKESKVLRERLGLSGYITETVKLPSTLEILGCKAEGVVFAKQIDGVDRVLLHVSLVDAAGKHSIVSSRKKVPLPEWQAITESLAALSISWRDKELKRTAK